VLPRGLYELLVTEALASALEARATDAPSTVVLRPADVGDRIAFHLSQVIARAIDALPDQRRVADAVALARRLVEALAAGHDEAVITERPSPPGTVLRAIPGRRPDGSVADLEQPLIPLLDTALLSNAPGEPRVGHQLRAEIASADRIDVVMAFIRRSGIAPLREPFATHRARGRPLRVLTTTYTGSTEAEAIEALLDLGADVRVSYDTTGTRLHAKAWLFHRESGFSTAYVGSSNLTHSAQVSGLEWNVRISGARNRPVVDKIAAVFESYWQQDDFAPYDRERFALATQRATRDDGIILSPLEIRLEPFQERLLEEIALSRQRGHHRNLLVAATGTGKTVMAAVDYGRLRSELPRARLLFVAHRQEILEQARATFRHALRDGRFGELWVGGERPRDFDHVFASIQSLAANALDALDPTHFDIVIVDEFHHAAAASYDRLLSRLTPIELLGLTATPERSDGLPVLHWFGERIAAELRLWDAIDQHRLTPLAYFGIADDLDLREVPWRRSVGYDVEGVTSLITGNDVWARRVLKELHERVGSIAAIRALGFCVSVAHARYMARVFTEHGVRAVAIWADSSEEERRSALARLARRDVNVVFSVDLFNEGVDVPSIDTLLMLRPTDSPLLFLQQLGRGLRRSAGKTICTVLDFVGQHRREFRYDRRFRALLGGSRSAVERQVADGFPFLPAGCHMELDRVAAERVLDSIRGAVPRHWAAKVSELRALAVEQPAISLGEYLRATGLDLDDVYQGNRSWSDLREAAGLDERAPAAGASDEAAMRRACGRVLHIDDSERLETWRRWCAADAPPRVWRLSLRERRLLALLLAQMLDRVAEPTTTLDEGTAMLWRSATVRRELVELCDVLTERISHVPIALSSMPDVPLVVHARYSRLEILAATGSGERVKGPTWREGVRYEESIRTDLLVFTLDKTKGEFSPTTRYRDYAISRELIHWESQSSTRAGSPTGERYREHVARGSHVLLFARLNVDERAFTFLGPAQYVSHAGELPMAVTWRLDHPLPGDLFQMFAAAVA
jgi:superfamily II DNA or RNA helicase